jgi:hypothetical protein
VKLLETIVLPVNAFDKKDVFREFVVDRGTSK